MKNIFQKLKKPLLAIIILIIGVLIFSQTALGKRLNLPAGIIEAVKVFFAGNPNLSACDYKDGTIILIKPVATGVGDGRYEAGDIVEIRDGNALCERFGNGDPLGKMEKTNLLTVYYPAKLTEEQKIGLTKIERIDDGSKYGKIAKRRQEGVDYTKFLSDAEVLKVRSFEKLDRLPEIDLSPVIQKTTEEKSVVKIPQHLAKIENFRNSVKKVVRKIIPFAYAGTGGTKTICTSGCDYTTLSGWEGTEQGILAEPAIAQITGSFQDTTSVVIDGWTTTAANYIYIYTTAAARHAGVYSTSKYRLEATPTNYAVIYAYEDFVRIEGLQIKPTGAGVYTHGITAEGIAAGADFRVSNNIFNGANNGAGKTEFFGLQLYTTAGATAVMTAWNNIIYDFADPGKGIYQGNSGGTFKAYNNTLVDNTGGFYISTGGAFIAKNNLIKGAGTPASGTFGAGTDYNATDDSTMSYTVTGGGNTHDRLSQTFTFNNEAGDDFHLASGDAGAKDFGVSDPGSGLFSDDIDGVARSGSWDIGADEFVAATSCGDGTCNGSETHSSCPADCRATVINKPQTNFMNDDSLVGYWSFDGSAMNWASTTAEALDLSGNNNNGNVTNFGKEGARIGKNGQALSFDGSDDKVTVPGTATLRFFSSSFTTSAWVKLGSTAASNHDIIGNADSAYWFGAYGDEFFLGFSDTGGSGYTECRSSTANLDMSNFYHLVATFDDSANQIKLYLNGANVAAETAYGQGCSPTDNPDSDIGDVGIGFTAEGAGSEFFNGLIDEVRVYNRALSVSEISDLYKAGAAKMQVATPQGPSGGLSSGASGLVGYWSFNGQDMNWASTTAEALDRSGNNNNGNATNFGKEAARIGKVGQGLSFDGVDDEIDAGFASTINNLPALSISVWLKANSVGENGQGFIIAKNTDVSVDGWLFKLSSNNTVNFQVDYGGTSNLGAYTSQQVFGLGAWDHWVVTWDGSASYSNVHFYKNGVEQSRGGFTETDGDGSRNSDSSRSLHIGNSDAQNRTFNGLIDEVRIYNRALSASEIQALYQAGMRKMQFQGN